MAKQQTKKIIGIDIGSYSLKGVLLERQGDKIICLGLQVINYPTDDKPALEHKLAALTQVANLWKDKTKEAVLVACDKEYQIKFWEKPIMDKKNLDLVMHNEFTADIAMTKSEDINQFGFVYAVVGQINKEDTNLFQIMSVTFPLEGLKEKVALFKQAGLKLTGVIPFPIAAREVLFANYSNEIIQKETSSLVATIDLGADSNQLVVYERNVIRLSRIFPFAGEELRQSLVKSYQVDGQEIVLDSHMAEVYKTSIGLLKPEEAANYPPGALEVQVSELIRQNLERMSQKIRLSLDYFKGQLKTQVSCVYIFGGGANLRGLCETMPELIMVPEVKLLSPFLEIHYQPIHQDSETAPPIESASAVALAVGAALSGLKSSQDILNLLESLAKEAARKRIEFIVNYVVPLILLLSAAIIPAVYWQLVYTPDRERLKALTLEHSELSTEFAKVANIKMEYDNILKKQQDLRIRSTFIRNLSQRRVYWSKILMLLTSLVPDEVWLTELSSRAFLQDSGGQSSTGQSSTTNQQSSNTPSVPLGGEIILIKGYSQTYAGLSKFLKNLESSTNISNLTWKESKREGNSNVFFSLTCTVVPGAK